MQQTVARRYQPAPYNQEEDAHIPRNLNKTDYIPASIFEIEISEALPIISTFRAETKEHYQRAWCVVRLHTQPLGVLELTTEDDIMTPQHYIPYIWNSFGEQINEHLSQDKLPTVDALTSKGIQTTSVPACRTAYEQFLAQAPFVSVVIATHDRPDSLTWCLQSLLALRYPRYELIIVDNAPSTAKTRELVEQAQQEAPWLRYLREDRPGVSWARNKGIDVAKGTIIVFTDDDVVVDTNWLGEMVRAFTYTDDVQCITGIVLPLEIETPAQCLFERYGSFPHNFKQEFFNMGKYRAKNLLFPFTAGSFGAGASMAFRADFIRSLGGFDPALGGIGPSKCGQDIDTFFNVIISGHTLVYTPSALLYHQHRRTIIALQKQIFNYGIGFTAYLTKNLLRRPDCCYACSSSFLWACIVCSKHAQNAITNKQPER